MNYAHVIFMRVADIRHQNLTKRRTHKLQNLFVSDCNECKMLITRVEMFSGGCSVSADYGRVESERFVSNYVQKMPPWKLMDFEHNSVFAWAKSAASLSAVSKLNRGLITQRLRAYDIELVRRKYKY